MKKAYCEPELKPYAQIPGLTQVGSKAGFSPFMIPIATNTSFTAQTTVKNTFTAQTTVRNTFTAQTTVRNTFKV